MSKDGVIKGIKMITIFLAKAIQDGRTIERAGLYTDIWVEKIKKYFDESENGVHIFDLKDVSTQIYEDEKGLSYKIYDGEWRGWDELYKSEKKYFFPLIEKSDIIIAAEAWNHPRRGKFTAKVIVEIEYALELGKKVFKIDINDWTFKEITKQDLLNIKKEKQDEITFIKFLERCL